MDNADWKRPFAIFKFIFQTICVLILCSAVFLVAISMSSTHIDLNRVGKTKGVIAAVDLTANKNGRNNLTIRIQGDPNGYSLYRFSQDYQSIKNQLPPGDTVTLYHNNATSASMDYELYQIDTKNGSPYSKDEHEHRERFWGRVLAFPGAFILTVLGFFDLRKRYRAL